MLTMAPRAVVRVGGIALLAAVVAAPLAPRAQRARLADATIAATPAIFLETPATDTTAFDLLQRVLDAAAVPYGLESTAPANSRLLNDSGRTIEQTIRLNGMRLGAALDAIAKVDPHFRWVESDGLVVVRGVPDGKGLLDRTVPHFAVTDGSPDAVLQTLVSALDPSRPTGFGMTRLSRFPTGGSGDPSRKAQNVSMTMNDATVGSILNAAARTDGALSWIINYSHAPPSYETASIVLVEAGARASAVAPDVLAVLSGAARTSPADSPPTGFIRIIDSGDVGALLTAYARQVHVRLGVEPLARASAQQPPSAVRTVDVSSDDPAAGIAEIVASDPRYEWSRAGGAFHVRPKAEAVRLSVLDKSVQSFSAAKEPIGSVLQRIGWLLGGEPGGTSGSTGNLLSSQTGGAIGRGSGGQTSLQQRAQELRATPITVTISHAVTIRDVLDAVCLAEGTLSWQLRPQPAASESLTLEVSSFNGWSLSQSLQMTHAVAPSAAQLPPRPAHIPDSRVPPALDRDIDRTTLNMPPWVSPFVMLAMFAHAPMGIELLPDPPWTPPPPPPPQTGDPRLVTPAPPPAPRPSVVVGPGKLSDALYILLERMPGYALSTTDGLISIAPTSLLESATHFMNVPLDRFEVDDVSIYRAVTHLRHLLNPNVVEQDWDTSRTTVSVGIAPSAEQVAATRALLARHVTLSVEHATPREILNRLIALHGDLIWWVSYRSQTSADPAEPVEANCTIQLEPFWNVGSTTSIGPYRAPRTPSGSSVFIGPVPAPPVQRPVDLPSSPRPPATPLAQQIRLNLPATTRELSSVLDRLGQVHRVPFGWDSIQPPRPTPGQSAIRPPGAQYYDLTGLTIEQALDKIVELLPEYAWSQNNGVYHVRLKSIRDNPDAALNRHVDHFEGHFANLFEARAAVFAIFDPNLPPLRLPPNEPERVQAFTRRPITVALTNVTVRDILDEIARQNGSMSWSATYVDGSGADRGLRLSSVGFDGWTIG